jgi:hypothetical protein
MPSQQVVIIANADSVLLAKAKNHLAKPSLANTSIF